MLEDALDCLSTQLEEKLNLSTNAIDKPCEEQENVDPNVQQDALFNAAKLKKKEVQSKNSKRRKTFLEKLRKGKRKPTKAAVSTKKTEKVCEIQSEHLTCCYHFFLN